MESSWQDERRENLEKFTNWVRYHRKHYKDFKQGHIHEMLENKDYLQWVHKHPDFNGLEELEKMVKNNVDPIVREKAETQRGLEETKNEIDEKVSEGQDIDGDDSLLEEANEALETEADLNMKKKEAFSEVFIEFFSRFHPNGDNTDFERKPF